MAAPSPAETYTNLINVKRIARPLAGVGGPVPL
jgi:hypothetical protein